MNDDERRAYGRGYSSGAKWPLHKPPMPPEPIAQAVLSACLSLRNTVDSVAAEFGEDDEVAQRLWAEIDRFDLTMEALGRWLLDPAAHAASHVMPPKGDSSNERKEKAR